MNGVTVALKENSFAPNEYTGNSISRFGQLNSVANNERIEMISNTPKTGRYVKVWIERNTDIVLQLCEVEVFRVKGKNNKKYFTQPGYLQGI